MNTLPSRTRSYNQTYVPTTADPDGVQQSRRILRFVMQHFEDDFPYVLRYKIAN
jgi:hypothetical protein